MTTRTRSKPAAAKAKRKASRTAGAKASQPADYRKQVLQAVNRYRTTKKQPKLEEDERLMAFAQRRADDMIARDYFSHDDPETHEQALGQLESRSANGEVLYQLEGGVAAYLDKLDDFALKDWKNSRPHAAIIGDKRMARGGAGVAVAARRAVVVVVVEQ